MSPNFSFFMFFMSSWQLDAALKSTNKITFFYLACAEDGKETTNTEAPENNPQYTTVYVGNLAPEARIYAFN